MTEVESRLGDLESIEYVNGRVTREGLFINKLNTNWNTKTATVNIPANIVTPVSTAMGIWNGKAFRVASVLHVTYATATGRHGFEKAYMLSLYDNNGVSTFNNVSIELDSQYGGAISTSWGFVRNPATATSPPIIQYTLQSNFALTINIYQEDTVSY